MTIKKVSNQDPLDSLVHTTTSAYMQACGMHQTLQRASSDDVVDFARSHMNSIEQWSASCGELSRLSIQIKALLDFHVKASK